MHIVLTAEQRKTIYPILYRKVFNEETKNKPNAVLAIPDGDGFSCYMAGYWINDKTFYIQDAGVLPEYRLKGHLKHFVKGLKQFKSIKFLTMTDNQNITAMKTLLMTDFKPIGGKFIDNIYYVEWLWEA